LGIAESLFPEEADGRFVVGGGIYDDHPHSLLLHAAFDLLEQPASNSSLLNSGSDPEPDQITVLPGGIVLLHCCPQGKAKNSLPGFRHQTELAVRIEEGGDLVFIPGPVEALGVIGGKDLFADMKDLGEIVDGHFPDTDSSVSGRKCFCHGVTSLYEICSP